MRYHPSVLILGYSEAAMFLKQPEAADVSAIISIYGHREYPIEPEFQCKRLTVQFDDAEVECEKDPLRASQLRIRRRDAAEIGLIQSPPTISHAREIIGFAKQIESLGGTLICQCLGGISRSSAAALLCLAVWKGMGAESDCVQEVLRIRPAAQPHRGLVCFGDEILSRSGRLVAAIDVIRP